MRRVQSSTFRDTDASSGSTAADSTVDHVDEANGVQTSPTGRRRASDPQHLKPPISSSSSPSPSSWSSHMTLDRRRRSRRGSRSPHARSAMTPSSVTGMSPTPWDIASPEEVPSSRDLLSTFRTVLKEVNRLNREIKDLRKEMRGYAEESSQWTLRYSRRIVSLSNITLAIYILGKRIVELVNNNSRSMLLLMINPMTWVKKPAFIDWVFNRVGAGNDSLAHGYGGSGSNGNAGAKVRTLAQDPSLSVPRSRILSPNIRKSNGRSIGTMLREKSSLFKRSWSRALFERYYGIERQGGVSYGTHHHHHHHHHHNNSYNNHYKQQHRTHHAHHVKIKGGDLQFMLLRLTWKTLVRVALLFFSSYYLTKREAWKRNLGLLVSTLSNVHMAFSGEISAWAIYFNMFITFLYITARYYKRIPAAIDSVSEHTRKGLGRTISMQNLSRFSNNSSKNDEGDNERDSEN